VDLGIGLAIVVSGVALVSACLSILALTRSAPARALSAVAESATVARECQSRCETIAAQAITWEATANQLAERCADEFDRIERKRRSVAAKVGTLEKIEGGMGGQPNTREEWLAFGRAKLAQGK